MNSTFLKGKMITILVLTFNFNLVEGSAMDSVRTSRTSSSKQHTTRNRSKESTSTDMTNAIDVTDEIV